MLSIEDNINIAILGFEEYVVDSDEQILSAARNIEILKVTETVQGFKKRKKNERQIAGKRKNYMVSI